MRSQAYLVLKPLASARLSKRVVVALLVGIVCGMLLTGWAGTVPVRVSLDGHPVHIPAGMTVGRFADEVEGVAPHGDLLSVDGSVLEQGGGAPPRIIRNGVAAGPAVVVRDGDKLESLPGPDTGERLEVARVPLAFRTVTTGTGSLTRMERAGVPGVLRVVRGVRSGTVVHSSVLTPAVDVHLRRVPPTLGMKVVALTFDDGPWPVTTERILAELEREKVRATFFMLGSQVKKHSQIARRVYRGGHLLGAHTVSHRPLTRMDAKAARWEMARGRRFIENITHAKNPWMRPPYGSMDAQAWRIARSLRLRVSMWSVDSEDWHRPGAKKIAWHVIKSVKPGDVVILHDGGGDRRQTVAALPIIIKALRKKGYVFVTVDEIAALRVAEAKARRVKPSGDPTQPVAPGP